MFSLNENYFLRKCFLEREQVPTQTVMKKKMSPPLANVYFKSMTPKLRVLAGFEPPMKGGGSDWYIPPEELLKGRVVMKPIKNKFLKKLSFLGIDSFSEKLLHDHHMRMENEKKEVLLENDLNWKRTIDVSCLQQWEDSSKECAKINTQKIQHAFHEFTNLYATSIAKVENLLFDAAINECKRTKQQAHEQMMKHYETLLKQQATMLYDRYTDRLMKEKARLKADFIEKLETLRTDMGNKLHDINVEKHIAIEKLRKFLECQKLACQVYVALKEREECEKEMELSKYEHKKKVKTLTEEMAMKDFEIRLALEKEKKRKEFIGFWQKKICLVVKKLQIFIAYCLHTLPEYSEFFLNMEKLILLQLNEAAEDPSAESLFEDYDEKKFHTPIARPHPFFLFCDKGFKPQIDEKLCPKHCTSSASQLPVIVVNKRFIYSACDNFEMFTNKMKEFIHGRRGDDIDFEDDHVYTNDVPVKYTQSTQLLELKLKSSLLQILQNDIPNVKNLKVDCCFCTPSSSSISVHLPKIESKKPSVVVIPSGNNLDTRSEELIHEREPKWESFLEYIEPKKCKCAKTAKHHLEEHLPAYMRNMSIYDAPAVPNYEPCSVLTLKKLVRKARGVRTPPPELPKPESKTKDMGTQYSDQEYEFVCTCFSDDEIKVKLEEILKSTQVSRISPDYFNVVDGALSPSYLNKSQTSFAMERIHSLRNLITEKPDIEEIFMKSDCKSE